MKSLIVASIIAALTISFAADANAHSQRGGMAKRFAAAVGQGVLSGALTPNEVTDLRRQIDALKAQAKSYRADGQVSQNEREQLRTAARNLRERLREFRTNNVRVG